MHPVTSALFRLVGAVVIDEELAHHLGSDRLEVALVLPVRGVSVYETQICLVHERGGLQRVVFPLTPELSFSVTLELRVDGLEEVAHISIL